MTPISDIVKMPTSSKLNVKELKLSDERRRKQILAKKSEFMQRHRVDVLTDDDFITIAEIMTEQDYCLNECKSINDCQYGIGQCGFYRAYCFDSYAGQRNVYFGVTECRHQQTERLRKRYQNLFTNSQIPKQFQGKTWTDWRATQQNIDAFSIAQDFIVGKITKRINTNTIYIHGNGKGKTMLACLIGNEYLNQGRSVAFRNAADMLNELEFSNDAYNKIRELQLVPVLIIDDLGSERNTAVNAERLYIIVNYRNAYNNITIITARQSINEIEQLYSRANSITQLTQQLRNLTVTITN